ncbi:MAG TPA: hypothetical protein DCP90_00650 [Clostridiales bacterium]|nr:MAG: hypothetical protein A2Y22_00550 [Clostridiales bacterium GWD2_32_59]HAN09106.1 hypothetical protein [Clostridiales bacterium]
MYNIKKIVSILILILLMVNILSPNLVYADPTFIYYTVDMDLDKATADAESYEENPGYYGLKVSTSTNTLVGTDTYFTDNEAAALILTAPLLNSLYDTLATQAHDSSHEFSEYTNRNRTQVTEKIIHLLLKKYGKIYNDDVGADLEITTVAQYNEQRLALLETNILDDLYWDDAGTKKYFKNGGLNNEYLLGLHRDYPEVGLFQTLTEQQRLDKKDHIDDLAEGEATATQWGVHRGGTTFGENIAALMGWVKSMAFPIMAFIVFIAVVVIGFKALGNATKESPKERIELMESFKNVFIGIIVVTFAFALTTFCFSKLQSTLDDMYHFSEGVTTVGSGLENPDDDQGNALVKILFNAGNYLVKGIRALLHGLIPGYDSVENLITMRDAGDKIEVNAATGDVTNYEKFLRPFTNDKLSLYDSGYWVFALICFPLIFIVIIKTGYMYIIYSNNYGQVAQVKDDVRRLLTACLFILMGPYIFRMVIMFFNMLTMILPFNYDFSITEDMKTGNFFGDIIGGVWLLIIEVQITFIFLIREVVLTVMYIVTPLVALTWAISKEFKLIRMWWGELFTNAATQFIYAMVFFVATIGISTLGTTLSTSYSFLMYLVWMSLVIKLAAMFKASIQAGWFAQAFGINEEAEAGVLTGKAMTVAKGVSNAGLDKANAKWNGDAKNKGLNFLSNARAGNRVLHGVGFKNAGFASEMRNDYLKGQKEAQTRQLQDMANTSITSEAMEITNAEVSRMAQDMRKEDTDPRARRAKEYFGRHNAGDGGAVPRRLDYIADLISQAPGGGGYNPPQGGTSPGNGGPNPTLGGGTSYGPTQHVLGSAFRQNLDTGLITPATQTVRNPRSQSQNNNNPTMSELIRGGIPSSEFGTGTPIHDQLNEGLLSSANIGGTRRVEIEELDRAGDVAGRNSKLEEMANAPHIKLATQIKEDQNNRDEYIEKRKAAGINVKDENFLKNDITLKEHNKIIDSTRAKLDDTDAVKAGNEFNKLKQQFKAEQDGEKRSELSRQMAEMRKNNLDIVVDADKLINSEVTETILKKQREINQKGLYNV